MGYLITVLLIQKLNKLIPEYKMSDFHVNDDCDIEVHVRK